jgi:isoaspartyl peptidase/L-asparaginase-like protein (Ntn-hydrolase superfamily)
MASGEVPSTGHAGGLQVAGELERRLAAELDDDAQQLAPRRLDAADLEHVLGGERLEVEPVGRVGVGRDGLRVAVDHHRLDAGLLQAERGVAAAVVELDALADPVRPAAEDDHLAAVGGPRLVLRLLAQGAVS